MSRSYNADEKQTQEDVPTRCSPRLGAEDRGNSAKDEQSGRYEGHPSSYSAPLNLTAHYFCLPNISLPSTECPTSTRFRHPPIAVAVCGIIIGPMDRALPRHLKLVAAASLGASFSLAALPFVAPGVPLEALTFVNWCLFMTVSYFACWPLPKWGAFSSVNMAKAKVLLVTLLAFTIACWMPLFREP